MNATAVTSSILAMKSLETTTAVQFAVAKKVLDTTRSGGDAVVQLINAAAEQARDVGGESLAASGRLDVYA
ncbi:MAG: hypothetical protein O7F76_13230 [Planctomycetota bacterium]|nr:hypothetical protein [Planctomycetota bacterium]